MADEDKNKVRLYANPGVDAFVSSSTTATIVFGASVEPIGKPPDDHEIYQLVGRVTSDWAHIEHTLDAIIWELAGLDPQTGACITAQLMGHGPRCLTITALATRLGLSEILPKVEKVKNHLFTISDERNRCVHDPWLVYAKTERTAQFRSMDKKNLQFGITQVDRAQIETLLEKIQQRASECEQLNIDIKAERESLPKKPARQPLSSSHPKDQ